MKTLKMPPFQATDRIPAFGRIYPGEWFRAGVIDIRRTYSTLVFSDETAGVKVTIKAPEREFPPDLEAKGIAMLGRTLPEIAAHFSRFGAKLGRFTPKPKRPPKNPEHGWSTQEFSITARPNEYEITACDHERGIIEKITEKGHGAAIVWTWINQQLGLNGETFFTIWAHIAELGARPTYTVQQNPYDAANRAA